MRTRSNVPWDDAVDAGVFVLIIVPAGIMCLTVWALFALPVLPFWAAYKLYKRLEARRA